MSKEKVVEVKKAFEAEYKLNDEKLKAEFLSSKKKKNRNEMCTTSFVLGLTSIFLWAIWVLHVLSIIFGIIGISKFDNCHQKGKWMGVVGLILGIAYLMVYIINYTKEYC